MEGTSPDPTCLFVGARGVGKSTLIRALQLSPDLKPSSAADYTLRLDTKYYTADVAVRALSTQQLDVQQQLHADAWEQLQALVLVFDASDEASFANIRSWADARDTDSIEVKLLVANKADTLQQQSTTVSSAGADSTAASCRTHWLQDAMSWCVDEGFEYVGAAAGKPAVDAAMQLDGEQQGVARVLAALQAHMWPGMVQKDWQPQTLPDLSGASTAAAAAAAVNAGAGDRSSSACRDQGSPAAVPAAAAADAVAGSNAGTATTGGAADATVALPAGQQQQQRHQQPNSAAQLRQSSDANGSTPAPQQQQQGRQQQQRSAASAAPADDDEGFDLDDFEQMMKQLQGMHTRLSHLPDDERRTAAADMALKLASMWGLGDEEASSEEGDAAGARADGQQQLDVRK